MGYVFLKKPDPDNDFDRAELQLTISENDLTVDELFREFGQFLIAVGYPETIINKWMNDDT